MPHSAAKTKKSAAGLGNIRKKIVTRNGEKYEYWEARYTAGYDPGTGKQIQRSITGKSPKEVTQKLKAVLSSLDKCYSSNYPRLESSDYLGNNRQNQWGQMTNRSIICGCEVALFAVKKLASDTAVTSTRGSRRPPSLWLFLVG